MHNVKNNRSTSVVWHMYMLGIILMGLALGGFVFFRYYVGSAHADYESKIYVPNYNDINNISSNVTPDLIVGIGPKVVEHKHNTQKQEKDSLIANVKVHYKQSRSNSIVSKIIKTKTKKPTKKPRPDWYINNMPQYQRQYLLKVRSKKVAWLKAFFARYNSPLKANVYDFVYASEYYGIDYRLLPAISIVESSGGKHLFKPYNPFGWGRHGYKSFHDAIWDVARGLSVYHYRLNRTTPESIGRLYNPVTPTHWARKVRYLMGLMPKY